MKSACGMEIDMANTSNQESEEEQRAREEAERLVIVMQETTRPFLLI